MIKNNEPVHGWITEYTAGWNISDIKARYPAIIKESHSEIHLPSFLPDTFTTTKKQPIEIRKRLSSIVPTISGEGRQRKRQLEKWRRLLRSTDTKTELFHFLKCFYRRWSGWFLCLIAGFESRSCREPSWTYFMHHAFLLCNSESNCLTFQRKSKHYVVRNYIGTEGYLQLLSSKRFIINHTNLL